MSHNAVFRLNHMCLSLLISTNIHSFWKNMFLFVNLWPTNSFTLICSTTHMVIVRDEHQSYFLVPENNQQDSMSLILFCLSYLHVGSCILEKPMYVCWEVIILDKERIFEKAWFLMKLQHVLWNTEILKNPIKKLENHSKFWPSTWQYTNSVRTKL